MRSSRLLGLVAALSWLVAVDARADDAPIGGAEGMTSLERQLEVDFDAIEAQARRDSPDCAAAGAALESMERSARAICELDPGPPCIAAKRRVAEAKERLREACPTGLGAVDAGPLLQGAEKMAPEAESDHTMDEPVQAAGPPAERPASGCAACAIGAPGGAGRGWLPLFVAAAMALARRRGRRARGAAARQEPRAS